MSTEAHQLQAAEPPGPQRTPAAVTDNAVALSAGATAPAWSDSPRQLKQAAQLAQLQPAAAPVQGGLPENLRSGIEALSGYDMSGVRVHRNSSKPAALQAHAYAQGQDIHLGPGQEKHLPHEAWHVVQQAQGRVKPTLQMKSGVSINDDDSLEREADQMGRRASRAATSISPNHRQQGSASATPMADSRRTAPVQRRIELVDREQGHYREMQEGRPASGKGLLYFTNNAHDDNAMFTPVGLVDRLLDMLGYNNDKVSDEELTRNIDDMLHSDISDAAAAAEFFTDSADLSQLVQHKGFRLYGALRKPLMRDPQSRRGGGFAGRFPIAKGYVYTTKSKEATEADLGELPPSVSYFHCASEGFLNVARRSNGAMSAGPYVYLRGLTAPDDVRDEASVFAAPGLEGVRDQENGALKNDSLTARLPQPAGDTDVWVTHKAYARKKSRGAGQIAAMDNWNALGYAGYYKHHGHAGLNLGVDWEWLHVQGSQNGGATQPDNLVAGTSSTNSAMIPFEDQINSWTAAARSDQPLMVRYIGKRVGATNLGKSIEIQIAAPTGLAGGVLPVIPVTDPLVMAFNPLDASVFDKMHQRLASKQISKTGTADAADINY